MVTLISLTKHTLNIHIFQALVILTLKIWNSQSFRAGNTSNLIWLPSEKGVYSKRNELATSPPPPPPPNTHTHTPHTHTTITTKPHLRKIFPFYSRSLFKRDLVYRKVKRKSQKLSHLQKGHSTKYIKPP